MAKGVTIDFNANLSRFTSRIAKATEDMSKFQKKTYRTGKKLNKSVSEMNKSFDKVGSTIKGTVAGLVAFAAAAVGIGKISESLQEVVALAGEQEKAEAKLAATLNATGEAVGYNVAELKKMASGLQNITTVGDETILTGQAILATFKSVRGEAFERATKAALDMSAVMGTDLNSSMVQLGKALNDPIKGLTALTRVGVTFTEQQKNQIKSLQESGDILSAQRIILQELESEFGGAAEALAKTFGGAVQQTSNAFGDLKEEIGFVITKNSFFIELTQHTTSAINEMITKVSENRDALQAMAKDGVVSVVEGLGTAVEVMRFFENGWSGIKLTANLAIEGIAFGLDKLVKGLRWLLAPLDAIFTGLVALGKIDVNPFDKMQQYTTTFRQSSGNVRREVVADIEAINKKYDAWGAKVARISKKIKDIGVEAVDAAQDISASTVSALSDIESLTASAGSSIKKTTDEAKSAIQSLAESLGILEKNISDVQIVRGSFGAADRIRFTENTGSMGQTRTILPPDNFNLREFDLPEYGARQAVTNNRTSTASTHIYFNQNISRSDAAAISSEYDRMGNR